ncbi:hypothetical protein KUTeg_005446 [Tegillarca granosa]|uniref:Protein mab-21 n=1 Tax=Tegillarca granosa TaxID=220873 RepID=A0ABQ9FJP8_TEGGR|nr:hypothetical protein KUTeg_005446 [Tegillarca granosa]
MERSLDLVLWEILNGIIGNREQVYIRRGKYRMKDIIDNLIDGRMIRITSGSKAEGLDLPGSDQDVMYVFSNINVNPEQFRQTLNSDLIMETSNVKPGFAKLTLVLDEMSFRKLGGFASALTPFDKYRIYLSSLLFREITVKIARVIPSAINAEPHGPCASFKLDGVMEYDSMVCLQCGIWPFEANEWIQRRRIKNWPKQELVKEIAEEGCHLVPIGNPLSEESHMEWRISFSLAEKRLIHSMNHTQILCYGLLKLYLKHVIDAGEGCKGLLCSYFLKTALFYCIEEDGVIWDQHNLLKCFWACFERLTSWIEKGYLPNYFIKSNNMIESKISGDIRNRLIKHLHNLSKSGVNTVMRIPMLDKVMTRILTTASIQKQNEFMCDTELYEIFPLISENFGRLVSVIKLIEWILALPQIPPVDKMVFKLNISNYYVYLTNHLYKGIVTSGKSNIFKYKQLRQLTRHILCNCTGYDICTGLLQYATLNFLTWKYSKVVCILNDVINKFHPFVVYVGSTNLRVNEDEYIKHLCGKGFQTEFKLKSACARYYACIVSCMFYPDEIAVEVKKYKKKYFDITLIPPKVYCYVLLFLTYHRTRNEQLRRRTLEKLHEATKDEIFINESEKEIVSALFERCLEIASKTL